MREKLIPIGCLLLAAIVGAGAQAPSAPASAAGPAVASASLVTTSVATPLRLNNIAGGLQLDATAVPPPASSHHGHRIFGLPVRWVVVGVAVVVAVITVAAIENNRDYTSVVHPSAPMP
ncbi:MAG: hypothetical protein ACTHJX_06440, partial [Terriglobales bacterium]